MMQGRNWDYYAQVNESRPQQQPEQNGDHLSECQEGVLTKHPRHRHWAVQELVKSNNAPAHNRLIALSTNSATQKQLGIIITLLPQQPLSRWKRDCHEGHTPITRMTCLDIAHTLHELANEGKLISGHALDIMEGTNWDYYAQKNESR